MVWLTLSTTVANRGQANRLSKCRPYVAFFATLFVCFSVTFCRVDVIRGRMCSLKYGTMQFNNVLNFHQLRVSFSRYTFSLPVSLGYLSIYLYVCCDFKILQEHAMALNDDSCAGLGYSGGRDCGCSRADQRSAFSKHI